MKKFFLFFVLVMIILGVYFSLTPRGENIRYSQQESDMYVYETEADSEDDCTSYEEYDDTAGVCYYECVDEAECDKIATEIDAEIATWYDEGGEDTVEEDVIASNSDTLRAEYSVIKGEKITLKSGEFDQVDNEVWSLVSKISPNWLTDTHVDTFQIFEDDADDTIAFVDDEDGNGTWRIGINIAAFGESDEKEQYRTIVHELAHIITLNSSQFQDDDNCSSIQLEEGCLSPTAYLVAFAGKFWTRDDREVSEGGNNTLYDQKPSQYVSEYASTNMIEDIAESFSYYVFSGKTAPDSLAAQKIAFFEAYPALVKIKGEMLGGVKYNMVRARKSQ